MKKDNQNRNRNLYEVNLFAKTNHPTFRKKVDRVSRVKSKTNSVNNEEGC